MIIENNDRPGIRLLIGADECLLLAEACRAYADDVDTGHEGAPPASRVAGALFRTLGVAFEALALVDAAQGVVKGSELSEMTLPAMRAAYGMPFGDGRAS